MSSCPSSRRAPDGLSDRVGVVDSHRLSVLDATAADADGDALRWPARQGLSLADRFCRALGDRPETDVLTADIAGGTFGRVRQIR